MLAASALVPGIIIYCITPAHNRTISTAASLAGVAEFKGRPLTKAEDLTTCKHGRRQSPIDIVTDTLIFDLSLHPVKLHGADQQKAHLGALTMGIGEMIERLENTSYSKLVGMDYSRCAHSLVELTISVENAGHDLLFAIIFGVITFSGGPLSYTYRLSEMRLKFGSTADRGSEHRVNSFAYPGELQLYAYNSDLYQSFSDAVDRPNGIAAFSSMLQIHARFFSKELTFS
ncbi:hypothetical protein Aperf_G00000127804 [Anoplocephala perfoliata]